MLLALILAQAPMTVGPIYSSPSSRSTVASSYAAFEFAPASGAGMGAACACNNVTGAKGETITTNRSSAAYCTKEGVVTTGLTNTSMVSCASGKPRVESDGTALGVLAEESRTNVLLRSEEFDNAAWLTQNTGVAAPTVTADQAVTPWGTTTAERIQFPATAAGQDSIKYQAGTVGQPVSCLAYIKGVSSSGNIGLGINNGTTGLLAPCAYSNAAWTLCKVSHAAGSGANFVIGNESAAFFGSTPFAANDVYVAGAQCEAAKFSTSYIATTSAAATRSIEYHVVNGSAFPATPFEMSAFTTLEWSSNTHGSSSWIIDGQVGTATGTNILFDPTAGLGSFLFGVVDGGSATLASGANAIDAGTTYKVGATNAGGVSTTYLNGVVRTTVSGTGSAAQPWDTITGIGALALGGFPLNGIISRMCVNPDAGRCTP